MQILTSGYFQFQHDFTHAVFDDAAALPRHVTARSAPDSRFGVYRNNVIASLIRAVGARYPVVRRLLWPESFDELVRLYVTAEPPRSPVLLEYGESFPQFIRSFGNEAALHYVADIAMLESARRHAYHAADATAIDPQVFATLPPDDFGSLRFVLHPSATLLSSRFPIVSLWEANQPGGDNELEIWRAECALVARPDLDVEVRRISAGTHAFLKAIAEGATVASAIALATEEADFDLADSIGVLVNAAILVGIRTGKSERHVSI